MPGTIQVTVLEFKGISSSSQLSAKSLKVSMGKKQYQTWDKGDFSFPITKLHEDLVVALLDTGGNEIAHADIRTRQIIEKGSWDEVFSINGGGHVHMKLQFILSEEERNRIRIMRESAVKKKLETNSSVNLRLSETASSTYDSAETSSENEEASDSQKGFIDVDVMSPKDEASQAGSSLNSATSSAISLSSYQKEGGAILETAIPNTTDRFQGAPSSPVEHGIETESPQVRGRVPTERTEGQPLANVRADIKERALPKLSGTAMSDKGNSVASKLQDDPIQESKNQGPLKNTSSNVRKMINAFENSQLQEVKYLKKSSPVQPQLKRIGKESLVEDWGSKVAVSGGASVVLSGIEPSQAPKELASTTTAIPSGKDSREATLREQEKSPVMLIRRSTSETAMSSGRMPEEQPRETQACKLSLKLLNSSGSSVAEGSRIGRGTGLKSSTIVNIQVDSNLKPKSLEHYKEECYSAQSSGMWIFPDNTRQLCITTAGKQVMKLVGRHHSEAKTRQAKKISSESEVPEKNLMPGTEYKMERNQKKTAELPESGRGSSPDNSSNGIVGQVIKIAVILGFGLLVLLTRQKEPRKKNTEGNDNLFHIPDYVD